ncbi:helix-turn-helix transcriptional regulator [Paenibacillus sp. sgz500958]|uniref:helix-turn-helix transcriptional regulator n=1 Tax=Paenibacillus sp. sgz500958 TaxID=3242475 RepID=UPI0036D375AC
MDFADKLQTYRKQKGMSQENLADVIGVSRQAVSKWESGQSYPEMDKMIALSELFAVSLDHLVKNIPLTDKEVEPATRITSLDSRSLLHYEYKSERTLFGVPLVHINLGRGMYVAKGIVAIGNVSVGVLSIGILALGGLCLGAVSLGIIGLAALAVGLLLAAGGVAAGAFAAGGAAFGIIAVGGLSVGIFSLGGCAIASRIAIGGYASGHIAIGDTAKGAYTLLLQDNHFGSVSAEQVRALISQEYPNLWKPLADRIIAIFS